MGNRTVAFCSGSVCAKVAPQAGGEHELCDDAGGCDPAGAVFQETLEDLNEVDRLLLSYASSANLAVVRWLFILGANMDACDSNGTTCLHTACRSGSLAVVREFIGRGLPLDTADVAGWTALHVALFMGRRQVAMLLMRAGAELAARNTKGITPASLCSDVWLREAIASCAEHRRRYSDSAAWYFAREKELGEDEQASSRLHFEPFFVPRAPVLQDAAGPVALSNLGVEIFNQRPGQGLAFLVATGCVRDYPVELSGFLAENRVSAQVGEFLGEDFSLSQTLRLEYINAVRLVGTGVISCLAKVFQQFQIPSDLHKIDRLVEGAAQIWWRQHDQLKAMEIVPPPAGAAEGDESQEVAGIQLMDLLPDYDVLHQLMLSAVLLHWNLYAPLPPSRRISLSQFLELNAGIVESGNARDQGNGQYTLRHVQQRIYGAVSRCFFPQLQIWLNRPAGAGGRSGSMAAPAREAVSDAQEGALDGWGLLDGNSLPSLAGLNSTTFTYRHIRSILSETTSTTLSLVSPATSRSSRPGPEPPQARTGSGPRRPVPCTARPALASCQGLGKSGNRTDQAWLSLRHGLLFLAPKPHNWAPYAFVHLRGACVQEVDQTTVSLVLAMRPAPLVSAVAGSLHGGSEPDEPQMQLVFLLPDGRWQVLDMPSLEVQFPDMQQLSNWKRCLEAHCNLASPCLGSSVPSDKVVVGPQLQQREI